MATRPRVAFLDKMSLVPIAPISCRIFGESLGPLALAGLLPVTVGTVMPAFARLCAGKEEP